MEIVCYGPWRAASLLWQPSPGAWALTVACHAVFELAPNESPVVAKPLPLDPVADDDERAFVEPWGPPAPIKRHPEVIVVGHAYAPPTRQVTSLVARLAVGDLEKLLHVNGESWFTQEGVVTSPLAFTKMPLRWDRAAGAPDDSNPAGIAMGKHALADTRGSVLLPNLRPMGTWITSRDEVFPPVGFGPIRPTWPSRLARLHHLAASWDPQRWAEQPLPAGFDVSYFNVAPADQALGALAGDERIVLEHLHPRFHRLSTYLAAKTPCVVASFAGVEQDVPVVRDTLVIDTDRGLAFLVWRGQVPLPHPQQDGVVFVSAARLGPSPARTMEGVLKPGTATLPFQPTGAVVETLPGTSLPVKPALPFRPAKGDASSAESIGDAEIVEEITDEVTDTPTVRRAALGKPFHDGAASGPKPRAPAEPMAAKGPTVASSIERCAAVAARLASLGAGRAAILEAEGLTAEGWEKEHVRWLGEINDELDAGEKKLLVAYDAAYVAAIEDLRGPIAAGEYARLSLAADRGEAAPVLAELRLPEGSTTRIRRVWRARMARDPQVAAEVQAALHAAKA